MPVAVVLWNYRFVAGRPRWVPLARTERSRRNGQNAPFVKRMIKSFWNTQTRTLARRGLGGFLPWERHRRDQPMGHPQRRVWLHARSTAASPTPLPREQRGAALHQLRPPPAGLARPERGSAVGR